jgi:hypothetical protein
MATRKTVKEEDATSDPSLGPGFKIPKTMGAVADLLYTTRQDRLKLQKAVDLLDAQEKALREHIINTLPASDSGAAGLLARVSIVKKTIPQVEDWTKLWAYVKRTGDFDLLQKRLSPPAVEERWEAKKKVPGVVPFEVKTVSLNKV